MANIIEKYESLPKAAKIAIQALTGYVFGGIYRILKYVENKNTLTLVYGILALIPGIDIVAWVLDLLSEISENKIAFFAE